MEYLRLENVSKSYGEKVLFSDLNFTLNRSDKVALIARNGNGKSTLLRIIAGRESSDGQSGRVIISRSSRIFHLEQDPSFDPEQTIIQALFQVEDERIEAIKSYQKAMTGTDDQVIQSALVRMEDTKAWAMEARMKEVLYKLNLEDTSSNVGSLSGGQMKRLAIAKMLLSEPDLLILDEPTNHLDIEMIEWLEQYLTNPSLTLLMVTHDRYFMERICNSIIELDKGVLFKYQGNYSDYLSKKALREEVTTANIDKTRKLLVRELEWVRRQPKARGTKAKSRVSNYERIKSELSSISYDPLFNIEIDSARLGKKIMEFYDASKAYGDKVVLRNFWYKFKSGEKVGVCGKNGTGKTSLVKLITGEIDLDKGRRVVGETVIFGHYRQDGLAFHDEQTVIDVIREVGEYIPLKNGYKLTAEKLLENFMFDRKQQTVKVSQLSGGEKKRLHLLKVLMANPNFLILDEPTNDLDVLTLNVLEDYLTSFKGCLLVVTHDRFFMDKLVDHLFILTGDGKIEDFNGTYTDWRTSDRRDVRKDPQKEKKVPSVATFEKSAARRLSYHEKREMQSIEDRLAQIRKNRDTLERLFEGSQDLQSDEIERMSRELAELIKEADDLEMRWLLLSEIEEAR